MAWFNSQYSRTSGKGAPKNINTFSPFYALASFLEDGREMDEQGKWRAWCGEWGEWIMRDDGLPKTQEGGFQHSTPSLPHESRKEELNPRTPHSNLRQRPPSKSLG